MPNEENHAITPDTPVVIPEEANPTPVSEANASTAPEVAPEAEEVPEEPKVAPIAALDTSLMRDVLGQMHDLHKTLTATLEQNIPDAQREHIVNAANILTSAAESISTAINTEVN